MENIDIMEAAGDALQDQDNYDNLEALEGFTPEQLLVWLAGKIEPHMADYLTLEQAADLHDEWLGE